MSLNSRLGSYLLMLLFIIGPFSALIALLALLFLLGVGMHEAPRGLYAPELVILVGAVAALITYVCWRLFFALRARGARLFSW